jgi:hypothetical protein
MDPIGIAGGLNLYGFAGGDPINFSDPFGLSAEACCRELASVAAGFIPFLGGLNDAATALTGRDAIAGVDVGTGGRVAAAAGVLLPVSGGSIRAASQFLEPGATQLARRFGTTFQVKVRGTLGRSDNASSAMIREVDGSGNVVSRTHRVVRPDGSIPHRHQTHIGRHGTERQFPDEWVQFPTRNQL